MEFSLFQLRYIPSRKFVIYAASKQKLMAKGLKNFAFSASEYFAKSNKTALSFH